MHAKGNAGFLVAFMLRTGASVATADVTMRVRRAIAVFAAAGIGRAAFLGPENAVNALMLPIFRDCCTHLKSRLL